MPTPTASPPRPPAGLLEDPERPSRAPERAAEATAELDTRGAGADIQVTEFIARRFRDELLFFTMNHPTNRMLGHIAQAISDQAGVPGRVDHHQLAGEILGSTFYPLHRNHVLALGLRLRRRRQSPGRVAFRIRGVAYEARRRRAARSTTTTPPTRTWSSSITPAHRLDARVGPA